MDASHRGSLFFSTGFSSRRLYQSQTKAELEAKSHVWCEWPFWHALYLFVSPKSNPQGGKKGGGPLHGVTWTHQEILFSVTSWAAALAAAMGAQDIPGGSASPPWKRAWQLSAFWKRVGTCAGVPARRHRLWLKQASFQWVLLLQSLGRFRKSPAKPCPLLVLVRGRQGGLSCSRVLPVHPLHWGPHLSLSFLAGAGEGDGGRWRGAHEEQPQCVSPGWAQQSPSCGGFIAALTVRESLILCTSPPSTPSQCLSPHTSYHGQPCLD